MVLWWIGNILLIFVVFPVVVILLRNILTPVSEIKEYADDVLEHGVLLIAELDGIDELHRTKEAVKQIGAGVNRYGNALQQAL